MYIIIITSEKKNNPPICDSLIKLERQHVNTNFLLYIVYCAGIPNVDPDDLLQFESSGPSPAAGGEGAPLLRSVSEIAAHSFADPAVQGTDQGDSGSLSGSLASGFSLTEAQEKAISSKLVAYV